MHEYPITCEVIRIAEKFAAENQAGSVDEIGLVVGDDSGFVGDSIQMYFEELAKDSVCKNAQVVIKHIKPKMKCGGCGALFERKWLSFECPTCRGMGQPTEIGKEFYVDYILVSK